MRTEFLYHRLFFLVLLFFVAVLGVVHWIGSPQTNQFPKQFVSLWYLAFTGPIMQMSLLIGSAYYAMADEGDYSPP